MMAGQAEPVVRLLQEKGCYDKIQLFTDLADIERFALAYRC
jgi:release factor glutamine methyltransferase